MPHQGKVEVGAEVETHKVIHLLAVPFQGPPDLHEHLFRTLSRQRKGWMGQWEVGKGVEAERKRDRKQEYVSKQVLPTRCVKANQ